MQCTTCGAPGAPKPCPGCKTSWYCNASCQSVHWQGGHKSQCGRERVGDDVQSDSQGQQHSAAAAAHNTMDVDGMPGLLKHR